MKKKNRFEIQLREQTVAQSVAELEGVEHNDQEEVRVETNREGNVNEIEEEGTNNDEAKEESKETANKNKMLWGEAPDKSSILFGYKDSWAVKVCQTRDHARCTKLLKRQRAKHWALSKECALVRDLVVSTGLGPGILNFQTEYDSVVVSAFRERYWLETDTFHLPFGEMTITPDDVKKIIDLEVEGQSVFEGFNNNMAWTDLYGSS
ncbi:uncharacterized protein LOC113324642 [Papaver somniferum]|uniref:uncharacterized protein LOC113324642 n=1 Tax=Papaver somniferum TaxID=3469 RepID=UPI000E6F9D4A|nr:uncharacterized protein LOC113324642 [Papaver somniferum]